MGVKGLTRYVRLEEAKVMKDFKLHNSRLVIDGDNFAYLLWSHFAVNQQFGGDYDEYAKKCRVFIGILRTCKVEPYIVFDGGDSLDGRKVDTILDRKRQRVKRVEKMCESGRGEIVPILAKKTFMSVLAEMAVPCVTCDFEADREMAVLANKFGCPVMSFDSDFFVFDLKAGYIPFNFVKLATDIEICDGSFYEYVPVKLYTRRSFAKRNHVIPELLSILACILGNDYVDAKQLKNFYFENAISLGEKEPEKFRKRVKKILKWLKKQKDVATCLDNVLQYIDDSDRNRFKIVLQSTIDEYCNLQSFEGLDLEKFFVDNDKNQLSVRDECMSETETLYNRSDASPVLLPSWFRIANKHCQMTPHLQDVALLGTVYKDCQVEVLAERTTYGCSKTLREIMYTIILGQDSDLAVEEYDREGKQVICFKVKPVKHLPAIAELPTLETVPYRKHHEMFNLLLLSLELPIEFIDKAMPNFSKYLVGLVTYWIRHSQPMVNINHCHSVLMGVILLHARLYKNNKTLAKLCFPENVLVALSSSSGEQLNRIHRKTEKYFQSPLEFQDHRKDNYIVHAFAQFQVCLKESLQLNELLMLPMDPPNPGLVLSNSFLYNFYRDLRGKTDKMRALIDILGDGSPVYTMYRDLFGCVESVIEGLDNVRKDHFDEKLVK